MFETVCSCFSTRTTTWLDAILPSYLAFLKVLYFSIICCHWVFLRRSLRSTDVSPLVGGFLCPLGCLRCFSLDPWNKKATVSSTGRQHFVKVSWNVVYSFDVQTRFFLLFRKIFLCPTTKISLPPTFPPVSLPSFLHSVAAFPVILTLDRPRLSLIAIIFSPITLILFFPSAFIHVLSHHSLTINFNFSLFLLFLLFLIY